MDFEDNSTSSAAELLTLATVCGQSFMGESNSGALVLSYSQDTSDVLGPRPGEKKVGFTIIDGERRLGSELAVQSLTSKILTSGQVFDQDGRLNFDLADFMDAQAGRPNSLADLNQINAHFPLKEMNAHGVHALNERLVSAFAQSHDWVASLEERTTILTNGSMGLGNKIVDQSIQSLHDFLDMARDINKKNTLKKINEESMTR